MTLTEALQSLQFNDQFKMVVRDIHARRDDTIRDLIQVPTEDQATLVGKLAAYQELVEQFTS